MTFTRSRAILTVILLRGEQLDETKRPHGLLQMTVGIVAGLYKSDITASKARQNPWEMRSIEVLNYFSN